MNRSFALLLICLAFSCSDYDGDPTYCIQAEYLTYEHCSNFILLDVTQGPIGKPFNFEGKHYNNVIKVVGNVPQGARYFRVRKFDREKDEHLLVEPLICLAIYAPYNVPRFVVEAESTDRCP